MHDTDVDLQYMASVCISGLTASGKTTHSHLLSGEFGLTYVSASQIQLNFQGVSPIQSRDFWITPEAQSLWTEENCRRVDAELLRIESTRSGCVFDTATMPWRHQRSALCIWLESSVESRVLKAVISHRGKGRYSHLDYQKKIEEKDSATIELYRRLFGLEIGTDLSCFDLVIDISDLVSEPTLDASLNSIRIAHAIIRPAVGWYVTGRSDFRAQFKEAADRFGGLIKLNKLL